VFLGRHFLFTCSDTFDVGCIVYPQCTASQTDGRTDNIMMPITDPTVCSTIS